MRLSTTTNANELVLIQQLKQVFKKWLYLPCIAVLLLGISFWLTKTNSTTSSEQQYAARLNDYIKEAQEDFKRTSKMLESESIDDPVVAKENFLKLAKTLNFYLYQYDLSSTGQLQITDWSSNVVLPTDSIILSSKSVGYTNLANGHYIFFKQNLADKVLFGLLPIKWNYFVTNNYLKNNFVVGRPITTSHFDISVKEGSGSKVVDASGNVLFNLKAVANKSGAFISTTGLVLAIVGFLFLFFYFNQGISSLIDANQMQAALVLTGLALLILRITLYFIPNVLGLTNTSFFNRTQFQGAWLHHSIGDWLINLLLLVWVITTLKPFIYKKLITDSRKDSRQFQWWQVVIKSLVATLVSFSSIILLKYLVSNDVVSFDILNVYSLDYFTLLAFLIIVGTIYIIYQVNLFLIERLNGSLIQFFIFLFASVIFLLMLISVRFYLYEVGEDMLVAAWLIVFQSMTFTAFKARLKPGVARLGFLFLFAISASSFILYHQQQSEIEQRSLYASRLATKANPVTEMMLGTITTEIEKGFNEAAFLQYKSGERLRQVEVRLNTSYSNRFSYKMFFFNEKKEPLQDSSAYDFEELNAITSTQARSTHIPNLFTYETSSYQTNFIYRKTIKDSASKIVGHAFFQIIPRSNANSDLYPELFNKQVSKDFSMLNNYALAIYNNDKIVYNENEFPFPTILPARFFKGQQEILFNEAGYSQLWQTTGAGKAVVIVKKNSTWLSFITLFSYLFSIMLLLAGVWIVMQFIFSASFSLQQMGSRISFNISERIQGAFVLLSVASFFIIGIVTILFFVSRSSAANQKKLSITLDVVVNQLEGALEQENINGNLYDSTTSRLDSSSIYRIFSNIAETNGIELNLFDANAELQFSTLPLPYTKQLTSGKMDPFAYLTLFNKKKVQYFQNEKIGTLSYVSAYRALINANGETYGFIQSPFFRSEVALKNDISDFLVAMINLMVFIFLLSGLVAIFITSRMTNALRLIGDKMKMISLGKSNQAIAWKGNDEISTLIRQYNSMLAQLEESAVVLAKQEREYAWQEMAKQVAHEIKNPLTPMKLSMQFLQKVIESNAPNVKEITASTANTIINQIDHLSSMAGEFSQFAQIGNAKPSRQHLQKVLVFLKQLYDASTSANFDWEMDDQPIYIMSDETYINRLFTNLLQNAVQSGKEGTIVNISVKLFKQNDYAMIKVEDSGTGISEDLWPKIFVPNFTTKSSGTGLGLAMSKRIAEQAGGDISFTSSENGTCFTVSLPVVD